MKKSKTLLRFAVITLAALLLVISCAAFSACGKDWTQGEILEISEAYELGYLDREDVLDIAYCFNDGNFGNEEFISDDYKPKRKNPDILTEDVEALVREAEGTSRGFENPDIIIVRNYIGTYGDCMAVTIGVLAWGIPESYYYTLYVDWIKFYASITTYPKIWHVK